MAIDAADLVNQALRAGGVPDRVGDLYDGSEPARIALELYGQCRDELMRATDWSFARRVVALTRLKGPPPGGGFTPATPWTTIYPYPGFLYEYAYPSDCLDLRAIIAPPGPMPDLDPQPALFRVDNDLTPVVSGSPPTASGPPAKVILCNMTNALGVYRARVTDPATWEPGFIATFVATLGKKFAKAFGDDPNANRANAVEAAGTAAVATEVRG